MAERQDRPRLELPKEDIRIGITRAQFNPTVTDALVREAKRCLDEHEVAYDELAVPGSFELPYTLQQQALSGRYDALIAIGCLIKGETIHFEVLAYSLPIALHRIELDNKLPVGFGIVTANTQAQAQERSWLGYDAAYAVLASLLATKQLRQ